MKRRQASHFGSREELPSENIRTIRPVIPNPLAVILAIVLAMTLVVTLLAPPADAGGSEAHFISCTGNESVYSVTYGSGFVEAWAALRRNAKKSSSKTWVYSPWKHDVSGSGYWSTSATDYYSYYYSHGNCA